MEEKRIEKMIKLPMIKIATIRILNFLIMLDLIFGGSGRLIMLGPISFRTALFGFAMLYTLVNSIRNKFRTNSFFFSNAGMFFGLSDLECCLCWR